MANFIYIAVALLTILTFVIFASLLDWQESLIITGAAMLVSIFLLVEYERKN